MDNFAPDYNELREKMLNPKSEGERNQVEKIKKFSEDPEEIIRFRNDLEKIKEDWNTDARVKNQTSSEQASRANERQVKQRRRYDQPLVNQQRPSIFRVLANLFSLWRTFSQKYSNNKNIRISFINLLTNGFLFYPGNGVTDFMRKDIVPLQEMLRPFMKAIYQYGWRNSKGKKLHDPYVFNLIGEFDRLQNSQHVEDFLANRQQVDKAMQKLNAFLGYYLSVTGKRESREALLMAMKKSITNMVSDEVKELSGRNTSLIIKMVEEFLSLPIRERVIIPLFESYLARTIEEGELDHFINTSPISSEEYYADPQLKIRMQILEEKYLKYIADKKVRLETTIQSVNAVIRALEVRREHAGKSLLLIDYCANKRRNLIKGLMESLDLFSHQKPFLSVSYFLDVFYPLLRGPISIKKEMTQRTHQDVFLFDSSIFQDEYNNIRASMDYMQKFAEKFQARDDIFQVHLKDLSEEQNYQLIVLNNVADQFFNMANKITKYFSVSVEDGKGVTEPMRLDDFGKKRSMFDSYYLHALPKKVDFHTEYDFFQKTIADIMRQVEAFCLQYTYFFEHQQRQFKKGDARNRTLKNLIEDKVKIEKELEQLRTGEEAE